MKQRKSIDITSFTLLYQALGHYIIWNRYFTRIVEMTEAGWNNRPRTLMWCQERIEILLVVNVSMEITERINDIAGFVYHAYHRSIK